MCRFYRGEVRRFFLAESGVIGMCGLFWKMRGKWFRLRDCKIVALDRSFNILL